MKSIQRFSRLKLRHVLLIALLLSGIIPLAISSILLILQNQEVLRNAEQDYLVRKAGSLSREVNSYLVNVRRQLRQIGGGVLSPPGPPEAPQTAADRLNEGWVSGYLQGFLRENPDFAALGVVDPATTIGPVIAPRNISKPAVDTLKAVFGTARNGKEAVYGFVKDGSGGEPLAAVAVPVAQGGSRVVVETLVKFEPLERLEQEARGGVTIFLLDGQGKLLWSNGGDPVMEKSFMSLPVIRSFLRRPMAMTTEYEVDSAKGRQDVFAQVSAMEESGWIMVVQKPLDETFVAVDRMIFNTVLSSLLLVALALFFAFMASRWVSLPIQRLAEKSHDIAAGNFGGRVEMEGLAFELADLADDFNRMSGHVETYVQQLRQAAQANRDLFIGSLRAFVAAIDAKDPYTRGHSERVAAVSRTISRYLGLPEEVQHKVWIGALLHDVGKIGVEDRILRKEGVLTPEEFEQMKAHATMGADIMMPIEQLKEMIPAIRWHHEAWNGRGYPDGLKGEQIPLFARIVAVADTFDAITTNRPYQQAYSLQFAVETITRLTGSRFDAKIVTAFLRAFEAGEIRAGAARQSREATQVEVKAAAQR
ncbi:MAG TPA: HD domain-containing phosphohydrolase [Thermoanaerobaculia bacterium]|nr:HD domain-containing phosphohydrolase [Thermoanaerobaculia bacterium]